MGKTPSHVGRFVWYELLTPDTDASVAFYGDVVGWKTQAFEGGGSSGYKMWIASQGPLGGVMSSKKAKEHAPEPQKVASPPHWMAHVQVENVDATVERAKELGGSICYGPEDIPNVGRFAVIGDPQGATLSVFKPNPSSQPMPLHDDSKPGEFGWNELLTTNKEDALKFYGDLFGWKTIREVDLGKDHGTYLIYGLGEKVLGGMYTKTKGMQQMPTAWTFYARVSDIDAAVARAKAKGGKVISGPMEVPGGDRIAQLVDPLGAPFALLEGKKTAA
jgi:predicted enzyme related to lactoylglutathione lyase